MKWFLKEKIGFKNSILILVKYVDIKKQSKNRCYMCLNFKFATWGAYKE